LPALLFALVAAPIAPAQTSAAPPGSELRVYLMTMGPGAMVWERFGHNAIWVHDPSTQPDTAYNYGLFDFRQENFLLRFARGDMWYWMAGFPAEWYVQSYRRDNRSVWLQELNVPPAARLELREFLRRNAQPENRFYHYDYYYDNCSTRVRDAIDRVIGGAIRKETVGLPTGKTFRFHTQRLTSNDPLIFTALLTALGQRVDRPITAWQEMFLPMALREYVRGVNVTYPDGTLRPLVQSERTVFESTAREPPAAPPPWLRWYLLLGLVVGGITVLLGGAARHRGLGRFALGTVATLWGLIGGLGGVVLAGLWGLTDHVMAYRNENLFQVNPLILGLAILVPAGLAASSRARHWARVLSRGLVALSMAGLALKLIPAFDQVNGEVIALALPIHLGVAIGLQRARRN
jgi:hypothetical protein